MKKLISFFLIFFFFAFTNFLLVSQANASTRNVWMNDGTCTDDGFGGEFGGNDCGTITERSETSEFTLCSVEGDRIRWTRQETNRGPTGTQDTTREDRQTTYTIMTCTTINLGDKLWVKGRVPAASTDGHRRFCQSNGYLPVYSDAGGICASEENRPGTYNYTVLGLGGTPNGGGDFFQRDSGSNRCYKNGQKKDDDRSDKDEGSLCQEYEVVDTTTPTQVCTPNEVDTASPSPSCGTGYTGTITRTNTCNSDGSAWLGWEDDRSDCVANVCTPNQEEDEEISCGTGYVGNQSRTRSCSSDGSSWGNWGEYDRSSCTAIACTANSVEEEREPCGTGFAGDQTRTNTCNSSGTAYLGWTNWNRSACVLENQDPFGLSIGYTPGKTSQDRTITVRAQDDTNTTGLLSRMILQENKNGEQTDTNFGPVDVWNEVTNWRNLDTSSQVTRTWVRSFDDGATYKYRLLAYDQQNTLSTTINNNTIEFEADVVVITPPSISSSTHTDGVESDNDSPRFNIINNHGAGTNQYCLDEYDTCIPDASSTGNTPNFAALPNGDFFMRARTCDGANCSDISDSFKLIINKPIIVCTANETEDEEVSCGSGYVGNQSRIRTCSTDGTSWGDWTEYDASSCTPVSCTAGSTDSESISCGSGFTGNQSRNRTCNASGTGYGDWTTWNRSSCTAADASAPVGTVFYTPAGPNWTTGNVRVDIDCSDDTGCDMYNIPDWSISGNRYSRTFASNNTGSIELRDNNTTTAYTSVTCQDWEMGSYTPGSTINPDFSSCEPSTYSSSSAVTCGYYAGVGTDGTETFQPDCSSPSSSGRTSDNIEVSGGTTVPGMGSTGCRSVVGGMYPYYTDVTSINSTYSSYTCSKTYYGVPDPAGTGASPNTTNVPYNVDYIDTSTPGAPTITADDRSTDIWSNDSTTIITSTPNTTGEISPRTNRYCIDTDPSTDCTPNSVITPNTTNLSDGIYYYRVRTCTSAGRCGPIAEFIIKIDTTAPTAADLSIVPGTSGPLLANDNQNFQVSASNAGASPINVIEGFFEDAGTINSYLGTPETTNSSLLNFSRSIEDVDIMAPKPNGFREYALYVYRICDEAGNCTFENDTDGIRTFRYNVYANTSSLSMRQVTDSAIDNSSNVADGTDQTLVITLEDIYGNAIVPAPTINRTINFDFNTDNSVYLNQYTRSSGSSIFTDASAWQIGNNIDRNFSAQTSADGTYDFNFRAYTPTYDATASDGRELADGNFNVNNIQANITGSIGARSNIDILNSSIPANFTPLYTTDFGGELTNNGFIEGAPQSSNVDVSKSASSKNPSSRNMYFMYGGETDRLRLDISRSGNPETVVSESETNLSTLVVGDFSDSAYGFNTLLTQEGGTIDDISETFLSSHITYNLDGYSITYNSDVIGKSNYYDSNIDNNTNQSGIRVTGISSSQDANALTDDQFTDDLSILGKITKSTSRKDIQSSVFRVIKNITPNNGGRDIMVLTGDDWSTSNDGKIIYNNRVLFFGDLAGANVDLGNGSVRTIEGKKTIVVEGGNLYIRSNIQYGSNDDILGIVVLKDEQGRGGNLYIDPSVTEINATIYVDKSVMSYASGSELDGNAPASGLANQLYIYGSLFSENTIGGSRANPLVCPYYVAVPDCDTSVKAQTYDLNYLRRYFVDADRNKSGNRASKFSDEDRYFEYPVVVEYNSRIQSTPPPLFD